ncbi:MAG: hypothetical protein KDK45_22155, partial [Leptospiraceae bacterium]|nr:hypothetical protein [Leptospiraceae bacterium]
FILTALSLLISLVSCIKETETSDEVTVALTLLNANTSNQLTTYKASQAVEIEGKVTVVDDNGTVIPLFANVEENIKGSLWSADYSGVAFPLGAAKTGSYFHQILEFDNTKNVMITRRGTVCYGSYVGSVSTATDPRCTGTGGAGVSLSSVTIKAAADDATIVQSSVDIGYFVSSWTELNDKSITYLCLVGPFKTYKEARTHVTSNNFTVVTDSKTACKDRIGRSAVPTTIDADTNRFGYAPFPLKITK